MLFEIIPRRHHILAFLWSTWPYLSVVMPTAGHTTAPDTAAVDPPMVRLVNHAEFLLTQKPPRLNLAIGKYEEAVRSGAGSARVLNRLSELYMAAGKFADARRVLGLSLEEEPGQLEVYSWLGEAFIAIGRPDSAILTISEARELAPKSSGIRSSLGFLYLQSGLSQLARAQLDTALALDSGNPEAHRYLGLFHTQQDSLQAALTHYRRVVEIMPNDVEAQNNVAFLLSALHQYEAALEAYRRTKELTVDPTLHHAININMDAIRAILNGKMRARYILVETQAKGRAVLEQLSKGEDFGVLAARFSKAPNASDGGDLGFFGPGDMIPEVEEAVLRLGVGETSDLLRIADKTMIIQRLN